MTQTYDEYGTPLTQDLTNARIDFQNRPENTLGSDIVWMRLAAKVEDFTYLNQISQRDDIVITTREAWDAQGRSSDEEAKDKGRLQKAHTELMRRIKTADRAIDKLSKVLHGHGDLDEGHEEETP